MDLEISFIASENIDTVLNRFKDKNFSNYFLPSNISTGLNFATKIIIVGLSLKKGDVFVIENPEIHLHPKAISKFANFFTFLVSKGIQVIIETHSNYLLSKLRYLNYTKHLKNDDVVIYYKDQQIDFKPIFINFGKFYNEDGIKTSFPTGFFDTDLENLMEIR
ncbi:TPA: AAA family ATPase [Campylobacter lari]|nr:AAA family ATPase [Campylobacter lari]